MTTATQPTAKNAQKLQVLGEPARLKILCLLFDWQEGCVSSIAEAGGASVATTSYHLNTLADHGYLTRHKDGRSVCYRIVEDDFVAGVRELLCLKKDAN